MPRKRKSKKQTRLPSAPKAPKKKAGLKAWRTYSKNMKEWRAVCADIKSAHRAICSQPPMLPLAPRKPSGGGSVRRPKAKKAKRKASPELQALRQQFGARQFRGYGQPMFATQPKRKKRKVKTQRASRYGGIPMGLNPQLFMPRAAYR